MQLFCLEVSVQVTLPSVHPISWGDAHTSGKKGNCEQRKKLKVKIGIWNSGMPEALRHSAASRKQTARRPD